MMLKKVLFDLELKQNELVRHINNFYCERIICQSALSKIVNGFKRPNEMQRLALMNALSFYGLSDRNIFSIKELEKKERQNGFKQNYNNW